MGNNNKWVTIFGIVLVSVPAVVSAQTCVVGTVTFTLTGTMRHTLFLNGRSVSGPYSTVTAAKTAATTLAKAQPDSVVTFGPTYRQAAKYCKPPTLVPPPPPPADSLSPTGYRPLLTWTPERQAIWNRMRAENHWLHAVEKATCEKLLAGVPVYGERGTRCAFMYQSTGERRYALAVWDKIRTRFSDSLPDGDAMREGWIPTVLDLDVIWPALSLAQQDSAVTGALRWMNYMLGASRPKYTGALPVSDSDALVGVGGGLLLSNAWLGKVRPGLIDARDSTSRPLGRAALPIGDYCPSVDQVGVATTIRGYTIGAEGGVWPEGSQYDVGTVSLLARYVAALEHLGITCLDKERAFLNDYARQFAYAVSHDTAQRVIWGSMEGNPRVWSGDIYRIITTLGVMTGTNAPDSRAAAAGIMQALWGKFGRTKNDHLHASMLWYVNPYLAGSALPEGGRYAPGKGHFYIRHQGTLVYLGTNRPTGVHHDGEELHDVHLYRNGEWLLTAPVDYGREGSNSLGANGVSYAGRARMAEHRAINVRADSGPGWWATTAATKGLAVFPSRTERQPWLTYGMRTQLFTRVGDFDAVLVRDSSHAVDPRTLPLFDSYDDAIKKGVEQTNGETVALWHAPVEPTVSATGLTWTTPSGVPVRVLFLSDAPTRVRTHFIPTLYGRAVTAEYNQWQAQVVSDAVVRVQVVLIGRGTPPAVSRSGNTTTIGAKRFTITSTTITAQ